jgi:polyisoprenoid-binding protein YceI
MPAPDASTATVAPALPLAPGPWTLDAGHSSVVFSIRHLGLSRVRGRFDDFDATLRVGPSLDEVQIDATVKMSSIDTNQPDRDAHLRSTDFFDVERHPTMHFASTQVRELADGGYVMAGELSINGTTRPIELEVEFHGTQTHPNTGALHAGFTADGELKRSDYGIEFGLLPIGVDKLALADTVKFELDLQFVAPTA